MIGYRDKLMLSGQQTLALIGSGMPRKAALDIATSAWHMADSGMRPRAQDATSILSPSMALAWAENAFATVEPSHKLAASLMCTSISTEDASELVLPWRCFCIIIPDGLFPGAPREIPAEIVVLQSRADRFRAIMWSPSGLTYDDVDSIADFAKYELDPTTLEYAGCSDAAVDSQFEARLALLLGRLVVGVVVEMQSKSACEFVSRTPTVPREKRGEPKAWVFKLCRPVKLDVRDVVRSYAQRGTHSPPSVQTLVRGHHKRQRHGPNNSLVKYIHVEPYWRGPEDAPIAVYSRKLEGGTV